MTMQIIPAIDLRDGKVVRLAQGDYSRETRYLVDPIRLAEDYFTQGATWLHVVDLDGARAGGLQNLEAIGQLCETGLKIQAGGGVRERRDVDALFEKGVSRVVVGSVAIRNPEAVESWISDYGAERICVALDTRLVDDIWTLPSAGWTQTETTRLDRLAPHYASAGALHFLCTDIACDGMMAGPNFDLYRYLRTLVPTLRIQASGGARDASDVAVLKSIGVAAVILGRSLLEGRLELADALAC
ncbi:MAG: 1-(5-phosphoribosyl)-5-[(5-phosphoribosylamino)methylideneamino]imidazole-4-carboxamide isomerase [Rudaea sp.]